MKGVTLCVTSYSGESADSLCSTFPQGTGTRGGSGRSAQTCGFSHLLREHPKNVYGSFMDPEPEGVGGGVEGIFTVPLLPT